MAKSKRNRVVPLTKVGKKDNVSNKKLHLVENIQNYLEEYEFCFVLRFKNMTSVPDVVILVGQTRELNAVKECLKLGITLITILDTNCDPTLTDFFVPANDDSIASVALISEPSMAPPISSAHAKT